MKNITIDKIEEFSLQEIFDFVSVKLMKQGVKSIGYDGKCLYKNREKNTCCAVGFLIPDELYTSEIEGKAADGVLKFYGKDHTSMITGLLRALQGVHDNVELTGKWMQNLILVANRYELNTKALKSWEEE